MLNKQACKLVIPLSPISPGENNHRTPRPGPPAPRMERQAQFTETAESQGRRMDRMTWSTAEGPQDTGVEYVCVCLRVWRELGGESVK